VLSTPSPRRARLVRLGLATSAVLVLAAPAAAVVWPDDEPVSATASTTGATANPRVAPSVDAETWVGLEDEPVAGEEALPAPLTVRTRPTEKARLVDLGRSEQVVVTGETRGRWAEVVVDDESRWVRRAALADTGPEPEAREKTRRSPRVDGRNPGAGGADAKLAPSSGAASTPGTAPAGAAAAPAPKAIPQPAPADSEPVAPTPAASEPTPAPSATPDEPPTAWEPAPDTEPAEAPAPDPAQDPVVDPWATLPPELEPAPDPAAAPE
jgi:hypothetical protein